MNCKDCINRTLSCHNIETCPFWAKYEKEKALQKFKDLLKPLDK